MFRITRKRPNPRRWLYRLGFAALALGIIIVFVRSVVLPRIIRGKVDTALRQLGVASPAFELRNAGLWGTELRNISEGGDASQIRIGAVSIVYGPIDASGGRIDSITLRGAELFAALKDGKLDLGPFSRRPASEGAGTLPFKRLRLESSTLHLDWEGQALWLPLSGTLTNDGGGRLTLEAQTFAAGSPLTVSGVTDPATDSTTLEVAAPDVNLASLVSSVPQRRLPAGIHAGGRTALQMTYRDAKGQRQSTMKIEPRDAWADALIGSKRFAIEGATLRGEATLDVTTRRPTAVSLEGTIASVLATGELARDVNVSIRPHDDGDSVGFSVTARGDHWRLGRFEGDARGLFVPVAQGETAQSTTVSFTAAYQVGGAMPLIARSALAASGIDASHVGEAEVEGDASGFVHLGPAPAGRDRWQVNSGTTQVSLAPADVTVGGAAGATVRALAASLKLQATANPREAVVRLLDDSWVDWQAVVRDDPARPLVSGDARILLLSRDEKTPVLRVRFADAGLDVVADLDVRTDAPITLSTAGADVRVTSLDWQGKLSLSAAGAHSLDGTLSLGGGSVSHPASKTVVGGIDLTVPVVMNAGATKGGAFSVAELKVDGRSMPPVKGTISVGGTGAAFDAAWSPMAGADVAAKGTLDWSDARHLLGDADVTLKPFKLTDGAALASAVPALAGWNVTGTLGATGKVSLRYGTVRPRLTVTLDDVAAHDAGQTFNVEGLTGSVALESLAPPTTPGQQRLTASKLTSGKLALSDGVVEFRIEGPQSILIEQTNWGWAGGRVYSHAFRIDPQNPDVDVVLYADGLRVSDMLALLADNRATGEGTMFGRVPLVVRWPKITFGDGFLYTRPGAAGGLKFLDSETASNLLEQSDPRFRSDKNFALVKQRVVDALRDFQYDRLGLELQNDQERPGALTARLKVHGKGRTGPKPQELDLTFNFTGVDEVLNAYVGFQQWMSRLGGGKKTN